MSIIDSIGVFNAAILFVVCVLAVAFSPTRHSAISVVMAAGFMIMIGMDSAVKSYALSNEDVAYIFLIKIILQTIFLMIYMYLSAWPVAVVSTMIIGIFSYGLVASLHAINAVYYEHLMMMSSVAQILALVAGGFCGVRYYNNHGRSFFTHKSAHGGKK